MLEHGFLPAEITHRSLRIVLSGRERLLVERHRGIIGYSQDKLTVQLDNGYLSISGQGLQINEYSNQDLCVTGLIQSMEFV